MKSLAVDIAQLTRELQTLSRFSDAEPPAVTRVLFTRPDQDARTYFRKLAADAGLVVRDDPAGNLFARWGGREPDRPALGTGSHTDAIPFSGQYDGTVGVLGAIEAVRALKRSGWSARRSSDVGMITS